MKIIGNKTKAAKFTPKFFPTPNPENIAKYTSSKLWLKNIFIQILRFDFDFVQAISQKCTCVVGENYLLFSKIIHEIQKEIMHFSWKFFKWGLKNKITNYSTIVKIIITFEN